MTVTIECYTSAKPARPQGALVCTILLLTLVSSLAGGMSWGRSSRILGPQVVSSELGISFRPPRGFREGDVIRKPRGPALPFFWTTPDGGEIRLIVHRIDTRPGDNAINLCKQLLSDLQEHLPFWYLPFSRQPVRGSESSLGGFPGIQAVDEKTGTIVRVSMHPKGFALAVSLTLERTRPDETLLRIFERVCDSIEFSAAQK